MREAEWPYLRDIEILVEDKAPGTLGGLALKTQHSEG